MLLGKWWPSLSHASFRLSINTGRSREWATSEANATRSARGRDGHSTRRTEDTRIHPSNRNRMTVSSLPCHSTRASCRDTNVVREATWGGRDSMSFTLPLSFISLLSVRHGISSLHPTPCSLRSHPVGWGTSTKGKNGGWEDIIINREWRAKGQKERLNQGKINEQ